MTTADQIIQAYRRQHLEVDCKPNKDAINPYRQEEVTNMNGSLRPLDDFGGALTDHLVLSNICGYSMDSGEEIWKLTVSLKNQGL